MYQASVILRAGGVDPSEVCEACGVADADHVAVRSVPRWMRLLWRGPVGAMTLPWAIYVRGDLLIGDAGDLAHLVVHEMVHVGQWRRLGTARFIWRYLGAYLRGRRQGLDHHAAYAANPFEVQARELVDSLTR